VVDAAVGDKIVQQIIGRVQVGPGLLFPIAEGKVFFGLFFQGIPLVAADVGAGGIKFLDFIFVGSDTKLAS
jgi:hypothetical protein